MAPGYGISSIGNYANDPYFMYAYNGYNPNFMGVQQYSQAVQSAPEVQAPDTTVVTDPTFKGADKSEGSSSNTALLLGGTAVSAAALIYAAKKGNGKGIKEGFKNIYNSWFKKGAEKAADKIDDAAAKISNILKDGGKNLKEYTIQKDGMSFIMKDGKPVKIITQDKKVIDKAKDVTDWLSKNPSVRREVNGLALYGAALPKGVSLAYTREITDGKNVYRMIVENGKGSKQRQSRQMG